VDILTLGCSGHQPGRSAMKRFRQLWCSFMHDDPSLPLHGEYTCRKCGITYSVPWRQIHYLRRSSDGVPSQKTDKR
jgi:hypothetical protein